MRKDPHVLHHQACCHKDPDDLDRDKRKSGARLLDTIERRVLYGHKKDYCAWYQEHDYVKVTSPIKTCHTLDWTATAVEGY